MLGVRPVRPKLTLAERTYRCGDDTCGHVADRDVNAAANLAAWGEHPPWASARA